MDGPLFLLHGGPLRSGGFVDYSEVDWESLDHHRELELELVGTGRSLILWFSVTDGHPYVSCGFSCEDASVSRWPNHLRDDARVVVRLGGNRVRARAEPVSRELEEHAQARAERREKFNAGEGSRSKAEKTLHGVIVKLGAALSGDDKKRKKPSGRLFRIVAPRPDPDRL